jgi:hypothetical protein
VLINTIVISIILFSGSLYSRSKQLSVSGDQTRLGYIKFICFILILQSGLRNVAVGADTFAYYTLFEKIKHTSWTQIWVIFLNHYSKGIGKDPGYFAIQKLIQVVIPNYQLFLFVISILFFSALGNFIYKNTTKLEHAIFAFVLYSCLFYNFFSITGHRQTIATAGTLFGYEFIKNKKFLLFLLLILIASTIHKSSLIFLPFYFFANIKNTKLFHEAVLIFFPFLILNRNEISNLFISVGGYEQYGLIEGAGAYTFSSVLLIVALVSWWRMKTVFQIYPYIKPLYNAFAIAVLLTPLTFINPNSMRVVQYFSIFLLVLIPAVIQSFQLQNFKIKQAIYGIAIFSLLVLSIRNNWNIEYRFFWQEMELGANYKYSNL